MVEDKVKDLVNPMEIIPIAHSYVYRYPSGRLVTKEDIENSNTDTAIYVLMRQAGECNDRKLEKGDYYITDIERENLRILSEAYKNTILVINVGGHIDLSFLDEIKGIDAVVLFVQGGEEGGNALSDVLSGKVNFSGKLSDTIPLRYEDIPFGDEFSYLNGDLKNEYYKEGIYVGYRYFDSFDKDVRYPFGFGLSYTDFKIETKSVSLDKTNINIKVAVTNIGEVSGKEVVQVYISLPGSNKEYQRLVTFQKTKELEKGETETMDLSFSLEDCTSYNEEKAAWILDEGDYILRVGNSSRNTNLSAIFDIPQTIVVTECKNCCSLQNKLPLFYPDKEREERVECEMRLRVNPEDFTTKTVSYIEPSIKETEEEKSILDSLTIEEEAWLLQGGDLRNPPKGTLEIHGAGGKTVTALLGKGIRNVLFSDGPAGVNIANKVKALPDGGFAPAMVPERYSWGVMGKAMKAQLERIPGEIVYRYATAWPVEMLLAQTWNKELLESIGKAVGEEMLQFGITIWLSPGMNIHRNPLGGRAFEY